MTLQKDNEYRRFLDKLIQLPVWIKEAVYIELRRDLEASLTDFCLNILQQQSSIYQFYQPGITFLGEKELASRNKNLSSNSYTFLECAVKKFSIIEMTLENFWTLEETSLLLLELVNQELIAYPYNETFYTYALYFTGKIRLGEYLVSVKKIAVDELDEALRRQKAINESTNKNIKMGDVLLEMQLITQEDIKSLLFLKEESSQRRILNLGSNVPQKNNDKEQLLQLKEKFDKMNQENKLLKAHLRKILDIKNKK